ncbi:tRNA pseudouridine synthase C [Vibrio stylophorae]|uniref:tRNA pseudouridine synthase C n=1 Tax=Vibrio stylophorae TaxID=659351 RepID=A0ABM8ZV85_9VIBR|nr:tRNA pseudouridine(65) synthase TruC [Vibrio stylophorae]CAH0534241.1 tRNA pseudouridine synthase C [Vibrio stylophorae]
MSLTICYQDEWLVAVNKPAGMLVHRSWLDRHETQFVMQTLRDQLGRHVFPIHRLDKPTSGVLLFALSSEVASLMQPIFQSHAIEKRYLAVVRGWLKEGGVLDYPLQKQHDKIADSKASQPAPLQDAITAYQPLAHVELPIACGRYETSRYSLLSLLPQTGRKHQLRRHLHHLSHHIIGDVNYGDGRHNRLFREHLHCHRLMLHALSLRFVHPITHQAIHIEADFDDTWQQLMIKFGWQEFLPQ